MKKILTILCMFVFAFVVVSCKKDGSKEKLLTPENVQITESGLVSWDSVENATGYIVTIGDASYTVNDTSYQVKDLKDDLSITVKATADNYETSFASEPLAFTGTNTKEGEKITSYVEEKCFSDKTSFLGDEAIYEACMDQLASFSKEAASHGITESDVENYLEVNSPDELSAKFMALSENNRTNFLYIYGGITYVYLNGLTKQYHNNINNELNGGITTTALTPDMSDISNISLSSFEKIVLECVALEALTDTLANGGYELAESISSIISSGLATYNALTLQVLPSIMEYINGTKAPNADYSDIIEIINKTTTILRSSAISEASLDNIIDIFKTYINNFMAYLKGYVTNVQMLPKLPVVFLIYSKVSVIDIDSISETDLAQSVLGAYNNILNKIDEINKDTLDKAFSYDSITKSLIYIVVSLATSDEIPEVTKEDVSTILYVVASQFGFTGEASDLPAFFGLTDEEFNTLVDDILYCVKADEALYTEVLNNLDVYLNLLDFSATNSSLSGVVQLPGLGDKPASEWNVYDEWVDFVTSYNEEEDSYTFIKRQYYISDIVDGVMTCDYYEYELTVYGYSRLIDLVSSLKGESKVEFSVVAEKLFDIAGLLLKSDTGIVAALLGENYEMVNTLFTTCVNTSIRNGVVNIILFMDKYINTVSEEELVNFFIALTMNPEEAIKDLGTMSSKFVSVEENVTLLHNICGNVADLLEQTGNLEQINATTRDEAYQMLVAIVDSLFGIIPVTC